MAQKMRIEAIKSHETTTPGHIPSGYHMMKFEDCVPRVNQMVVLNHVYLQLVSMWLSNRIQMNAHWKGGS